MSDLAYLNGLTPEQTEAVCDPAKNLCIIAGPGSGKTTVLTRRIALRGLDPAVPAKNTVAITFTNQAADELKSRLASLAVYDMPWVGTFHSFAFQILRRYYDEIRKPLPRLVNRKGRELAKILQGDTRFAALIATRKPTASLSNLEASLLISEISREVEIAKAYLITPDAYPAFHKAQRRETALDPETVATIFQAYEGHKLKSNQIDFEDLIIRAEGIMRENVSFAQTIRWWYRHWYVDEFQDVNAPQIQLLAALIGRDPDLCVVGDPKQAIYAWNGASPRLMLQFDQVFPGASFRYLTANFRSTPEIVDLANATAQTFSDSELSRHGGVIFAKRQSGASAKIFEFDAAADEASFVAKHIYQAIVNGVAPQDVAVIARTNSLLPAFQSNLSSLGIHNYIAGQNVVINDAALKAAISHLREILGPRGRLQDVVSQLDNLLEELRIDAEPSSGSESSLAYFRQLALEALRFDPLMDLYTFTNWFKVRAAENAPDKKRGVTLTTMHRSKGLEWNNVYVVALEQGILPHAKSLRPEAYEEEKRLLYVGITRARDHVYFTLAHQRGNSNQLRERSVLLRAIESFLDPTAGTQASRSRSLEYIRNSRAKLQASGNSSQSPDPIYETLRLWRKRSAADLLMGHEQFLTDSALQYIAATLPQTMEDLASCPGVGKGFAATHGETLLRIIAALLRASQRANALGLKI